MNNQSYFIDNLFSPNLNGSQWDVYQPVSGGYLANYLANSTSDNYNIYTTDDFIEPLLTSYYTNYYDAYYYCGVNNFNNLLFINKVINTNDFVVYYYIYNADTHELQYSAVNGYNLNTNQKKYLESLINVKCFNLFDSNYNLTTYFTNNIHITTTPIDTFIHSKQPSEYIFTMLYIFIPILLFIFALKVFKNGLFRK